MTTATTRRLGLAAAFLLATSAAHAGFTPVSPASGGEPGHATIFEDFYSPGTTWQPFGGRADDQGRLLDFANGLLFATRVDDWGLGEPLDPTDPTSGRSDDQTWRGAVLRINTAARYAGYRQEFGYDLDSDQDGYIKLFDVSGSGASVTGSAALNVSRNDTFRFIRAGDGSRFSSAPAENPDGLDHLVVYQVNGLDDGLVHWMLFWEDVLNGGDHDYNDLVLEVTASVPEPATIAMLLLGFGSLAPLRRR